VNAEFNWWLLIVGLVVGAALVYLVLTDSSRREAELTADERPREAAWIAATLRSEGVPLEPEIAERVLALHAIYLSAPPPDEPAPAETADRVAPGASVARDDADVERD
jgi:hypothetical protein